MTLCGGVGLGARAADPSSGLQRLLLAPDGLLGVNGGPSGPIKGYRADAAGAVLRVDAVLGLAKIDVAASAAGSTNDAASYGRGSGLDVGLGGIIGTQGVVGRAEALAPPSTDLVRREAGPVNLAPVAFASLLRGEAQARSEPGVCVLGSDLGYGRGDIGEVKVIGLAGIGGVTVGVRGSRSVSRTVIVPSEGGRLGLQSEVRQVLAPVTFLPGTANEFTLDVGGEWVLRATSDGESSSVEYQQVGLTPGTAPIRILGADGRVMVETSTDTAGESGTLLRIPGLAEIVIGGPPRLTGTAPGDASSGGTRAGAVADIVRVDLLGQEVKVGHMEATSAVEAGSLACPALGVELSSAPPQVVPGGEFDVTVKVTNPNSGTFAGTADVVIGAAGTDLEIRPHDGTLEGARVRWTVGRLGLGEVAERTATVRVRPDSAPGKLKLAAAVTGSYGPPGQATVASGAPVNIPASGQAISEGPEVLPAPEVPAVVGRERREARSVLEAAGYVVVEEETEVPNPSDVDMVVAQRPGGRLAPGSTVTIVVGRPAVAAPAPGRVASVPPPSPKPLAAAAPAPRRPAVAAPEAPPAPPMDAPAEAPPVPVPVPEGPLPPSVPVPPLQSAPPAPRPAPERESDDREWWSIIAVGLIVAVGLAVGSKAVGRRRA